MSPILLAYSGGWASSVALHGLVETHGASVVTLTLDVGQGADLAELRERALSGGAVRAHAIDAREELARDVVLPLVGGGALGEGGYPDIEALARPLMASKLVEVARIEGARLVAHGSAGAELDDAIHALDRDLTVLAPLRRWPSGGGAPADSARRRGLTSRRQAGGECRVDRNLWGRTVSWQDGDLAPDEARPTALAPPGEQARLDILFEGGVPVSLNGVSMSPLELVESLALIAGRHGVGRLEATSGGRRVVYDAPAAVVLRAAASEGGTGLVRLAVLNGRCTVLAPQDADKELVNHA